MRWSRGSGWLGVCTVLALAACSSDGTGPKNELRQLGVLMLAEYESAGQTANSSGDRVQWTHQPGPGDYASPEVLVAPDTVQAGQPFTIKTVTFGDGCWRADGQHVNIAGRTVEVKPYDVHSGHDACTMILLYLAHESTVTLQQTGEWTIRVTGRRARFRDHTWEEPISAEKTIVVR